MTASKYLMIHFGNGLLIFPCSVHAIDRWQAHLLWERNFRLWRLLQSVLASKECRWLGACCSDIREEIYKWFAFCGNVSQRVVVNVADWYSGSRNHPFEKELCSPEQVVSSDVNCWCLSQVLSKSKTHLFLFFFFSSLLHFLPQLFCFQRHWFLDQHLVY